MKKLLSLALLSATIINPYCFAMKPSLNYTSQSRSKKTKVGQAELENDLVSSTRLFINHYFSNEFHKWLTNNPFYDTTLFAFEANGTDLYLSFSSYAILQSHIFCSYPVDPSMLNSITHLTYDSTIDLICELITEKLNLFKRNNFLETERSKKHYKNVIIKIGETIITRNIDTF